MKITIQVSTQELLDLEMTRDHMRVAISEHIHTAVNDDDGGHVYFSGVEVDVQVTEADFDPGSSWTVPEALDRIDAQPNPETALEAVVIENIRLGEYSFASDLLIEAGSLIRGS